MAAGDKRDALNDLWVSLTGSRGMNTQEHTWDSRIIPPRTSLLSVTTRPADSASAWERAPRRCQARSVCEVLFREVCARSLPFLLSHTHRTRWVLLERVCIGWSRDRRLFFQDTKGEMMEPLFAKGHTGLQRARTPCSTQALSRQLPFCNVDYPHAEACESQICASDWLLTSPCGRLTRYLFQFGACEFPGPRE